MNILVDENIPWITVQELRALNHDVLDIRRTPQEGIVDDDLWAIAQREGRLLITTDKGFTEHRGKPHAGILIVRLRQPNRRKIHDRVIHATKRFQPHEWRGLVVVIRDTVQSVWRWSDRES
jgi:predicted nuclease of predicted toxin-antitoxin system